MPTINYNITYVDLILEGRRHDSAMLADSGLLLDLEQHAFSTTREPMALHGDPAYPLRLHLQVPYRGVEITPQMELYNRAMSSVRMSVEWLFRDIAYYCKFLDFKKNLKISLSAVYIVAAILRNALTCMYGNLTSEYFALDPPTIHDYFAWSVFNQVYLNQKV